RRELLGGPGAGPDGACDILWPAYLRWGESFADRLTGEFCCALWDGARKKLMLARDHIGQRPLFYHCGKRAVYFAAEVHALRAWPDVPRGIDDAGLARRMLALAGESSCLAGIGRVLPGQIRVFERGHSRAHFYWQPQQQAPLRLKSHAEYAAALRAALELAVRRQLPAAGALVTRISAGLDSTSVTALAALELARQGRELVAVTAVPQAGFDAARWPGVLCNEAPLAALVAQRHANVQHLLLPNDAVSLPTALRRMTRQWQAPVRGGANTTWICGVERLAAERGARCILGAAAGNLGASYSGLSSLPRLFAQGRWLRLAQLARGLHSRGWKWRAVANLVVGAHLSPRSMNRLRGLAGKPPELAQRDLVYVRPQFIAECGLDGANGDPGIRTDRRFADDGVQLRLHLLRMQDFGPRLAALWSESGCWLADPMADKTLLELCLAIPDEQFMHGGEPRALFRTAVADLLPPEVLYGKMRGKQSADQILSLQRSLPEWLRLMEQLMAHDMARRVLDLPRMQDMLRRLPAADPAPRSHEDLRYTGLINALSAGIFILQESA
ncbi:MAG: hypothetical protein JNJ60_00895, partial [Rhodocyclaceae bacterium]|nr:hypothetical protein [Rhodocyclaceae bacterium]